MRIVVPLLFIAVLLTGPLVQATFKSDARAQDWRTAGSRPMGWAPDPAAYEPAVVQAYCAAAYSWRGAFSDHCWIAAKAVGAAHYTRYEVSGFRLRRDGTSVMISATTTPDREWFGAAPKLLQDIRGAEAEPIVAALPAAVDAYPYADTYRMWPGPNSNTFIAHVARELPNFRLALPGNAIGRDFTGWNVLAPAPSGTGFQVSLGGILGVVLALDEGVEVNVLGLVFGLSPRNLAITLPGLGRIPGRSDWTDKDKYGSPAGAATEVR